MQHRYSTLDGSTCAAPSYFQAHAWASGVPGNLAMPQSGHHHFRTMLSSYARRYALGALLLINPAVDGCGARTFSGCPGASAIPGPPEGQFQPRTCPPQILLLFHQPQATQVGPSCWDDRMERALRHAGGNVWLSQAAVQRGKAGRVPVGSTRRAPWGVCGSSCCRSAGGGGAGRGAGLAGDTSSVAL